MGITEIKTSNPESMEIITLRFGKNEKYKILNQAILSIPKNMVKNYQIIDMDSPKEST